MCGDFRVQRRPQPETAAMASALPARVAPCRRSPSTEAFFRRVQRLRHSVFFGPCPRPPPRSPPPHPTVTPPCLWHRRSCSSSIRPDLAPPTSRENFRPSAPTPQTAAAAADDTVSARKGEIIIEVQRSHEGYGKNNRPRRCAGKSDGAEEGTRTPTAFRPPAPKAGASANSATSALGDSITEDGRRFLTQVAQALLPVRVWRLPLHRRRSGSLQNRTGRVTVLPRSSRFEVRFGLGQLVAFSREPNVQRGQDKDAHG